MTIYQALRAVLAQIVTAVTGLTPTPSIGLLWPPENQLQDVARAAGVLISIYDMGAGRNTTRFLPFTAVEQTFATGITSAVASGIITPEGTDTITLGGTVNDNDAVGVTITNGGTVAGAVAIAGASDTPDTMATKLAAAINGNATLAQWVTASAAGAVVTLTSTISPILQASSSVGNIANLWQELHRQERRVQIDVWAGTPELRETFGAAIASQLSYLHANFGVIAADNSWLRIKYDGSQLLDDDTLKDIYRERFQTRLEFGETALDVAYSVLVGIPIGGVIVGPPAAQETVPIL